MNITLLIPCDPCAWHRQIFERLKALPSVHVAAISLPATHAPNAGLQKLLARIPLLKPATITELRQLDTSLEAYLLQEKPDLLVNLTAMEPQTATPCMTIRADDLHEGGGNWFWLGMDPDAYPRICITEATSSQSYLTVRPVMQWSRWNRTQYLYGRIVEAVPIAIQRWLLGAPELTPPATLPPYRVRPLAILFREILRLGWHIGRRLGKKLRLLPAETFQVYYRPVSAQEPSIIESPSQWGQFTALPQPKGHYYADPFLFPMLDKPFIFVEDYAFATGKGLLRRVAIDGSVNEEILKEPFHLSYPQIFTHEEALYMIPETGDAKQILLYEAEDALSPTRWRRKAVLMDAVPAVDATLLHHDNSWWMFAAVGSSAAHKCDSLHLFYADALEGPYHPHPMNPVVIDATHARPAGPLFFHKGQLIRPSQDCLRGYGTAITFNKVEQLTRTRYAESCWQRLEPPAGKTGLHHYHRLGEYEVVDMKTG